MVLSSVTRGQATTVLVTRAALCGNVFIVYIYIYIHTYVYIYIYIYVYVFLFLRMLCVSGCGSVVLAVEGLREGCPQMLVYRSDHGLHR